MSIHRPKKKKVIKAASGINTDQIDGAITAGVGMIPGFGTAAAAALSIGKAAGKAITGDGSNQTKNVVGNLVNPFSTVNALAEGKFMEAIPVLGAFSAGKRLKKEHDKRVNEEQQKKISQATKESNEQFGQLTYEDGGQVQDKAPGLSDMQSKAVVLDGKSHKQGGNDVLDAATGEKVAETESQELLFSREQTKQMEAYIAEYEQSNDQEFLLKLGSLVKKIVDNDMIDYSGKFK